MTRPSVVVRDARADDLPELMIMWDELRELGSRLDRVTPSSARTGVLERLESVARDPDSCALVALVGDVVVGMVVLTATEYAPLFEQRAVHAHYLHVRDGFRRRGVGKALLTAAVSFADDTGAEHVITSVLPQMRDTQRFYARLGFGPLVMSRSVPVSALRRRLAGVAAPTPAVHLVARRRSLRRLRAAVARAD